MKICYTPEEIPIEVRNVNYISVQRSEGYKVSFYEGRRHHSFLYTVTGTMQYSFMDTCTDDIVASSGELVFIPAGTRHSSIYIGPQNHVTIVEFDLCTEILPSFLSTPFLTKMDSIEKIFSSIHNDLISGAANNPLYFLYRIYELLWGVSQKVEKPLVKYRKLQLALKEIHLYYSDNKKIKYYADMCGLSEPGFRRLFKEYTDMSPIEYRNKIRLEQAKKLLNSGEFYIEEVSLAVGFSNLSFFCRSYKQRFGRSPGKDI